MGGGNTKEIIEPWNMPEIKVKHVPFPIPPPSCTRRERGNAPFYTCSAAKTKRLCCFFPRVRCTPRLFRHRDRFHVYLEFACKGFDEAYRGRRVVVELRGDVAPYTCENFRRLCCGEGHNNDSYKGSYIHNVVPGESFGGGRVGEVEIRTNYQKAEILEKDAGRSTSSFDGKAFKDENFRLDHGEGTLSSRSVNGAHGSEFFFCLGDEDDFKVDQMNGEHVVFGEVVEGLEVLNAVGTLMLSGGWAEIIMRTQLPNYSVTGRPALPVTVVDCGELAKGEWTPPVEDEPEPGSRADLLRRSGVGSMKYKSLNLARRKSSKTQRATSKTKSLDQLASQGINSTFEELDKSGGLRAEGAPGRTG